jgi:hypothetical protein
MVSGAVLVGVSMVSIGAGFMEGASASTPSCGSTNCSGSDSNTGTNWQGNAPQLYVGEVGIYYEDFPKGHPIGGGAGGSGPYKNAFLTGTWSGTPAKSSGAAGAIGRLQTGSGLGVAFYYFLGGSGSSADNYSDPYCFGWNQGADAVQHVTATYSTYINAENSLSYMFMDIEQGANTGWTAGSLANNREVFDGFFDYVSGKVSSHSSCSGQNGSYWFQPGVYSAGATGTSNEWLDDMGSSDQNQTGYIPNTPIWPYENKISQSGCPDQPTSWGSATEFGDSSYKQAWQFCLSYDYDIFTDPMYMPYFGVDLY